MSEKTETTIVRPDVLEQLVREACVRVPVTAGIAGLTREIALFAPQYCFRNVLTRGGWYRLGGVIDEFGDRVADDIVRWAEHELAERDGDLHALIDAIAPNQLKATRLTGQTHYLVAPTGSNAADFVQIEIEELQEVVSHILFAGEEAGSLDEAIDPSTRAGEPPALAPIGAPFFTLRRITSISDLMQRIAVQRPELQNIHCFLDAWQSSSAGNTTHFSNHWVLAIREHLDRFQQNIIQATPVAAVNGVPPKFESVFGARGMVLNESLQRFDRQAGYPMAWFFHMLTTKTVPQAVAASVIEDVLNGFSYLPERDVKLVRNWLHHPYTF